MDLSSFLSPLPAFLGGYPIFENNSSTELPLHHCCKFCPYRFGSSSGFYLFHWSVVCLDAVALITVVFLSVEVTQCYFFSNFVFCQSCFGHSRSFTFHMNIRTSL